MYQSTITAKGQTTIPAGIRKAIGAIPGTRLVWRVHGEGLLQVRVCVPHELDTGAQAQDSIRPPAFPDAS